MHIPVTSWRSRSNIPGADGFGTGSGCRLIILSGTRRRDHLHIPTLSPACLPAWNLRTPPPSVQMHLLWEYIYIYIQFIQIGILEAVTTVIVPELPYRITI